LHSFLIEFIEVRAAFGEDYDSNLPPEMPEKSKKGNFAQILLKTKVWCDQECS